VCSDCGGGKFAITARGKILQSTGGVSRTNKKGGEKKGAELIKGGWKNFTLGRLIDEIKGNRKKGQLYIGLLTVDRALKGRTIFSGAFFGERSRNVTFREGNKAKTYQTL